MLARRWEFVDGVDFNDVIAVNAVTNVNRVTKVNPAISVNGVIMALSHKFPLKAWCSRDFFNAASAASFCW